ncbi:MAG: hypothetical protein KAT68_18560 [Bacteroidales bacterium]|nr:hypothetical protein [Bacteroidales bacterium]
MELKLYKYTIDKMGNITKNKERSIIAKIVIREKEIIKTIAVDKNHIVNGKIMESDYRSTYKIEFLDKYHKAYINGNILIKYIIWRGTSCTAFVKTNLLQRIYLKAIFEQYMIQRISGLKTIVIGILIGALSTIIGGLVLNFFICK